MKPECYKGFVFVFLLLLGFFGGGGGYLETYKVRFGVVSIAEENEYSTISPVYMQLYTHSDFCKIQQSVQKDVDLWIRLMPSHSFLWLYMRKSQNLSYCLHDLCQIRDIVIFGKMVKISQ